jgi:hypothetical protein
MREALDQLRENAGLHSPAGGQVSVLLRLLAHR